MDKIPDKELPSFTVKELASYLEDRRTTIGEDFILINNTFNSSLFRYPSRIKALVGVLCFGGTVHFKRNLDDYHITAGMLFITTPNDIVQVYEMDNFRASIIIVSESLIRDMSHILTRLLSMQPIVFDKPFCLLSEQDMHIFKSLVSTLELLITQPDSLYKLDTVKGIISVIVYKACDILIEDNNRRPATYAKNRQRAMYEQFMDLLNKHHCREHSVKFYAGEMCISPKYLSSVIKQVSGRSAARWIDEYVILEAKNLLRYSTLNIQEIAYYLNFSNQSFFGKYFKHLTGMTPGQYRALK